MHACSPAEPWPIERHARRDVVVIASLGRSDPANPHAAEQAVVCLPDGAIAAAELAGGADGEAVPIADEASLAGSLLSYVCRVAALFRWDAVPVGAASEAVS